MICSKIGVGIAEMTTRNLSHRMAKINFAMLATCTDVGALACPRMNYNGEVKHHRDFYYFTDNRGRTVSDIFSNSNITMAF